MTKQFTFDQFNRDSAAVYWHKGLMSAMGIVMKVTCHNLLTSAAFPGNEHGDLFIGDLGHHFAHSLHAPTTAYQAAKKIEFATLIPSARQVVLFAIQLRSMQGIEQLIIGWREAKLGNDTRTQLVIEQLAVGVLTQKNDRYTGIPVLNRLDRLG